MYGLRTEGHFDAAHFLSDYEGKCENLHGHRWKVVVYLQQAELQKEGQARDMVIDFADFKAALKRVLDEFDHRLIVEEGSLEAETIRQLEKETFRLAVVPFRTTAENLARYVCERLMEDGLPVEHVEMYETDLNCALYYPLF